MTRGEQTGLYDINIEKTL